MSENNISDLTLDIIDVVHNSFAVGFKDKLRILVTPDRVEHEYPAGVECPLAEDHMVIVEGEEYCTIDLKMRVNIF